MAAAPQGEEGQGRNATSAARAPSPPTNPTTILIQSILRPKVNLSSSYNCIAGALSAGTMQHWHLARCQDRPLSAENPAQDSPAIVRGGADGSAHSCRKRPGMTSACCRWRSASGRPNVIIVPMWIVRGRNGPGWVSRPGASSPGIAFAEDNDRRDSRRCRPPAQQQHRLLHILLKNLISKPLFAAGEQVNHPALRQLP